MQHRIIVGHVTDALRSLDPGSVQCVVTSPPYFNLRAYGTDPQVYGGHRPEGAPGCAHEWMTERYYREGGGSQRSAEAFHAPGEQNAARLKVTRWKEDDTCTICGAWRGEYGQEPTIAGYVAHTVAIFREVWRVLADDGVLWLNLGDSYANDGKWGGRTGGKHATALHGGAGCPGGAIGRARNRTGLGPKNLIGMPWRVALALQDDGWTLRRDIIWEKPNALPESAKDRCTTSHEYLFHLTKLPRYAYDGDAIREPAAGRSESDQVLATAYAAAKVGAIHNHTDDARQGMSQKKSPGYRRLTHPLGRNRRSVWRIPTVAYRGAHFATFAPDLITPCIKAGSRPGDTVLDPFLGSGTALMVADRLGRNGVGIELNPTYAALSAARLRGDAPLFANVIVQPLAPQASPDSPSTPLVSGTTGKV